MSKPTNLMVRIEKWDKILNSIHEDLKFLHEEFALIYNEVQRSCQEQKQESK